MSDLAELLEHTVRSWEELSHPSLMERFILRNGKPYTPRKRIGPKRKMKQCYRNAIEFILRRNQGQYVEGFVASNRIGFPIHHAWVTINGDDAMDPTLNAEEYQYFGVVFERETVLKQLVKHECYGVLDPGIYNLDLMFEIDSELREIFERFRQKKVETAR